ncbi:MAG: patatin-like phospholipase family protein [Alphaproteobacteria bacterium]
MSAPVNTKPVNLALQGGGSHGAFTWGVLDRLLEDGRLTFEGISGTSAGAMNAVVMVDGMMKGGPDGARQALHDFWQAVARAGTASPVRRSALNILTGDWDLDNSFSYLFFDVLSRMASPYQINPLDLNPLRDLVEETIDFERVHACEDIKLFISTTNVQTGRVKVFGCGEISADVLMASACIPYLYQAVEIEGVPYWDGGYMGNPALWPFFYECGTEDLLLVQINPMERMETPQTAREIYNRMNEITFNASLMREFRAMDFVSRLVEEGKLSADDYKQIRLHLIHGDEPLKALSASSKINSEWAFLTHLRDIGRAAAEDWLEAEARHVGKRASVDLKELYA